MIGDAEPEERRQPDHSVERRADMSFDSLKEIRRRSQPMFANERHQLIYGNEERDCINKSEEPENNEPGQAVIIAAAGNKLQQLAIGHAVKMSIGSHRLTLTFNDG